MNEHMLHKCSEGAELKVYLTKFCEWLVAQFFYTTDTVLV